MPAANCGRCRHREHPDVAATLNRAASPDRWLLEGCELSPLSARSIFSTIRCSVNLYGPEDIKPRLLGHWGTTPGLNLIYAHMNRLIRNWDLDVVFVAGPGHGGPGIVANAYLEGTYSEVYPSVSRNTAGMTRLFR